MTYPNLALPSRTDRPFFYTNFVQTIDGKVQVLRETEQYWPLGSETDYQTLRELRAHADVLLHGKHTALWLRMVDKLGDQSFADLRKSVGKPKEMLYAVCSAHPDTELRSRLINPPAGIRVVLFCTEDSPQLEGIEQVACGKQGRVSPTLVSEWLHNNGYRQVLHEGGPHLLGSFLAEGLVDELFLTLAPKVIGNAAQATYTLVEQPLFAPDQLPAFTLVSHLAVADELYLRYRRS